MINKPILNIVYTIALLCPVVSAAACPDINDLATNKTTVDCDHKAESYLAGLDEAESYPPAGTKKTGDQSEFSALEGSAASNVGSKRDVTEGRISSGTDHDNFEWMPTDWYEVY